MSTPMGRERLEHRQKTAYCGGKSEALQLEEAYSSESCVTLAMSLDFPRTSVSSIVRHQGRCSLKSKCLLQIFKAVMFVLESILLR